jgi:hypothetical protein
LIGGGSCRLFIIWEPALIRRIEPWCPGIQL